MPEWAGSLYPWMHLAGRIMFSMIFIMMGVMHLAKPQGLTAYAESQGTPAARLSVYVTGLMILIGGILLALGWHRFIGAGLIAIFLVVAAVTMHTFWRVTDEQERNHQMAHFFKNIALAGAALLVAYWSGGPWPMSVGG